MLLSCRAIAALFATSVLALTALPTVAAEADQPYADALLGDWAGVRSKLSDHGIEPVLEYKADLWSVADGGLKTGGNYNDNLDIKFAVDNEKLLGIKGNRAMLSFINNNGSHPNASRVGSVQGIDNIETGTDTFKLYEAWDEQEFLQGRLAVLLGLHDLNSEFAITDMAANFIKPTMQIGQSFAQSGQNGPSIFPTTGLAARVKVTPTETSYLSVAAFDGLPGSATNAEGTHIHLADKDGALLVAEAGITPKGPAGAEDAPNKLAIGTWTYTALQDDLVKTNSNGDPKKQRQGGAYFVSSYQFYTDTKKGRDLGAFLNGGLADGNSEQTEWDYEIGAVGHGWVPARKNAEIGLGLSQSHTSDKYIIANPGTKRNEYSYELYYRDQLLPGVSVQPDFQYIVNPGTTQGVDDATVLGLRLDVNF